MQKLGFMFVVINYGKKISLYLLLLSFLFIIPEQFLTVSAQQITTQTKKDVVKNFKADFSKLTPFGSSDCSLKSRGDANCDGVIDQFDLSIWQVEFNSLDNPRRSDFNNDGVVNLLDYGVWRRTNYPQKVSLLPADCQSSIVHLLYCSIVKTQKILSEQFSNLAIKQFQAYAQENPSSSSNLTSSQALTSSSGNNLVVNTSASGNTQQVNFDENGNPISSQLFGLNGQNLAATSFLDSGTMAITTQADGVSVQINRTGGGAVIEFFRNPDGSLIAVKSWPTENSYQRGDPPLAVTMPGQGLIRNVLNIQPNGDGVLATTDSSGNILKNTQMRGDGTLVTEDLQNKMTVQSNSQIGFTSLSMDNNLGGKTDYLFYQNQLYTIIQTKSENEFYVAKPLDEAGSSWNFQSNINGEQSEKTVTNPIEQLRGGTPDPTELIRYINYYKSAPPNTSSVNFSDGFTANSRSIQSQITKANEILTIAQVQPPAVLGIIKEAQAATTGTLTPDKNNPGGSGQSNWVDSSGNWVTMNVPTGTWGPGGTNPAGSMDVQVNFGGSVVTINVSPSAFNSQNGLTPGGTLNADGANSLLNAAKNETPGVNVKSGDLPGSIPSFAETTPAAAPAAPAPVNPAPAAAPAGPASLTNLSTEQKTALENAREAAGGKADTQSTPAAAGQAARGSYEQSREALKSAGFTDAQINTIENRGYVDSFMAAAVRSDPSFKGDPTDPAAIAAHARTSGALDQAIKSLDEKYGPSGFTTANYNAPASAPAQNPAGGASTPTASRPAAPAAQGVAGTGPAVGTQYSMGGFTATVNNVTRDGTITTTVAGTSHGNATFTHNPLTGLSSWTDSRGTFTAEAGHLTTINISGTGIQGSPAGTIVGLNHQGSLVAVGDASFIGADGFIMDGAGRRATNEERAAFEAQKKEQGDATGVEQYTVGNTCFLPGTLISTPQGPKSIETLKPGDRVYSYNEKTQQKQVSNFEQLDINFVDEYLIINNKIKATVYHPFYIVTSLSSRGNRSDLDGQVKITSSSSASRNDMILKTVRADALKIGDILQTEEGNYIPVSSIKRVPAPKTTVYNLMNVSPNNNFFAEGILVHNYDWTPPDLEADPSLTGADPDDPGTSYTENLGHPDMVQGPNGPEPAPPSQGWSGEGWSGGSLGGSSGGGDSGLGKSGDGGGNGGLQNNNENNQQQNNGQPDPGPQGGDNGGQQQDDGSDDDGGGDE